VAEPSTVPAPSTASTVAPLSVVAGSARTATLSVSADWSDATPLETRTVATLGSPRTITQLSAVPSASPKVPLAMTVRVPTFVVLTGVVLTGVDVTGVVLIGVVLIGVVLIGVVLIGVVLIGVAVTGVLTGGLGVAVIGVGLTGVVLTGVLMSTVAVATAAAEDISRRTVCDVQVGATGVVVTPVAVPGPVPPTRGCAHIAPLGQSIGR